MTSAIGIERLGDRAIRFPRPPVSALALVRRLKTWPEVVDVVVARHDVAIYFDHDVTIDPSRVAELAELPVEELSGREIVLHARYDGEDLDDVARATGLTVADVIARHQARTYTVDTMGFAPGFAYLTGLDPALELPRRATPRERVPAGSIAIAGEQTAVYPFDSPGGWHLIGRVVGERMFDASGPLLALGDRVRFVA